jgi:hypothetical protein
MLSLTTGPAFWYVRNAIDRMAVSTSNLRKLNN